MRKPSVSRVRETRTHGLNRGLRKRASSTRNRALALPMLTARWFQRGLRDVFRLAALGLIVLLNASNTCPAQQSQRPKNAVDRSIGPLDPSAPIRALLSRDPTGHQFVVYADCCSGGVHPGNEANFRLVNAALARLKPMPEFICFPGDNIMGETPDYQELRRQWRYWLDHEMDWLDKSIAVYPTTSNHNTYDAQSEAVWREVFAYLPSNAPDD